MKRKRSLCTDATWKGKADCAHCEVKSLVLFADVSPSYLSQLLIPIDNLILKPNTILFSKGEAKPFVYTIRSGCAKLVRYLESGNERIVRLHGIGDALGLETYLHKPYQNTAISLHTLDVCRIPVEVLKTINKETPDFSKQLFNRWEAALEQADYWITNLSTGPMRTRIVWLVYYLLDNDNNSNSQIRLPSAEDMAAMLGTSKETISRLLSELRHYGVIKKVAPKTYACNLSELDRYAQN